MSVVKSLLASLAQPLGSSWNALKRIVRSGLFSK